jgi:hypothetical protein
VALLEVNVTLPPAQNVVALPGVMVGMAGMALIVTAAEFAAVQPEAVVTVRFSVTLPVAPAVYVTFCAFEAEVIVPLLIDQAYEAAPAGPDAVLPAELAHTCAGVGVIDGMLGLQSMTV